MTCNTTWILQIHDSRQFFDILTQSRHDRKSQFQNLAKWSICTHVKTHDGQYGHAVMCTCFFSFKKFRRKISTKLYNDEFSQKSPKN